MSQQRFSLSIRSALKRQRIRISGTGDRDRRPHPVHDALERERRRFARDRRIEHIEKNGNIAVRLETGRRVAWNLKEYSYLDHAYAMTSHSSQGMTVDRVLIHVDTTDSRVRGLVDKTLSYVATSRAAMTHRFSPMMPSQLGRRCLGRT